MSRHSRHSRDLFDRIEPDMRIAVAISAGYLAIRIIPYVLTELTK